VDDCNKSKKKRYKDQLIFLHSLLNPNCVNLIMIKDGEKREEKGKKGKRKERKKERKEKGKKGKS
jgi:ribosomal protein L23